MSGERDLLVRYGEIGLKGGNRSEFEKRLASNIKTALRPLAHGPVERPHGRIVVREVSSPREALERVARLPGVISASVAIRTGHDRTEITRAALEAVGEAIGGERPPRSVTFKVESVRSDKNFPLTSMELSARLGGEVLRRYPALRARMKDPELTLRVEVRREAVLLSALHRKGPGGLPVGSTGKVMVLLSGGIDSPVAAYLAMKRGARAYFINFHSYPFIPMASLDKIRDLVRALGAFQGSSLLYVVPFSEIQVEIKRSCPEPLRTLLYRRMMIRLAERAAAEEGALALVTGESLGQVASQTLENMGIIGNATRMPVLRPLVGMDKTETVELAERIGTFEVSIRPYPDSCTVFQPRRPRIRGKPEEIEEAEKRLEVERLVDEAFARTEREKL